MAPDARAAGAAAVRDGRHRGRAAAGGGARQADEPAGARLLPLGPGRVLRHLSGRDVLLQVMLRYTLQRMLIMIPALLVISLLPFTIIKLQPGAFLSNQIAELQSQGDKAELEKVDFLRKQYGLDKPFLEQYAVWVGLWPTERGFSGLLQGDLGWSFEHDLPVKEVVGDRLLLSFILNFSVILFTWAVAFPIGVYAATRQYSWGDHGLTFLGYIGLATPNFLFALVLMYFANIKFGLSIGGIMDPDVLREPRNWAKSRPGAPPPWVPAIAVG